MPHDRLERRSLAMHRAIAEKLRAKPELLSIPKENLDRWIARGGRSTPYWERWRAILNGPLEEVLRVIQEDSPGMIDMRQSTPFAGVLTPKERWRFYDESESGTHHPSGRDDR